MNGLEAVLSGGIDSAGQGDFAFNSNTPVLTVPGQQLGIEPLSGVVPATITTNPSAPATGSTLYPLATIPHLLGYVPASEVFCLVNSNGTNPTNGTSVNDNTYQTTPMVLTYSSFNFQWINYSLDDQEMIIYYQIDSGGGSGYVDVTNMQLTFKYYIFDSKLE